MKIHTSKTRTKKYLSELKNYFFKDYHFPIHKRNDILLLLEPKQIYEPFEDQRWEGGGHIAKRYFVNGIDFLKNQPLLVTGTSGIAYYGPTEEDLRIIYNGDISTPLEIIGYNDVGNRKSINKVSDKGQFNKKIRMHVDAYDWYYLSKGYSKKMPPYIWLPHPTGINSFKELLPKFIHSKRNLKDLEEVLENYYSNLSN